MVRLTVDVALQRLDYALLIGLGVGLLVASAHGLHSLIAAHGGTLSVSFLTWLGSGVLCSVMWPERYRKIAKSQRKKRLGVVALISVLGPWSLQPQSNWTKI